MFVEGILGVELFNYNSHVDERGSFQRVFDQNDFSASGLNFVQSSLSINPIRGTVRGLHFQVSPSREWKYVTCVKGDLFDVLVDVRSDSSTYGSYLNFSLSGNSGRSILIPPGVAHGFQTLSDNTHILYHMTEFYDPELSRTLRWNDPAIGIQWPTPVTRISAKDKESGQWPVEY
jgi:dTDP-4-dehydrorhamnose 3,5-epimerase